MNPGRELRDGDAGKDADEQLPGQSIFDTTLVENGIRTLWFATVFFSVFRREEGVVVQRCAQYIRPLGTER